MTKFFALVPLLAVALAVPAQAQEISVSVGYGDLDLTRDAGVARLDHRIDAAVEAVCGDRIGQQSLSEALAIRKCTRDTMADVQSPRQIAINRARGKIPSVELADASSGGKSALTVRRR